MKTLKNIIEESDDFLRVQKERKDKERETIGVLAKHYDKASGDGVKDYTAFSGDVNSHLWNKNKGTGTVNPTVEAKIQKLDSSVNAIKTPISFVAWSKSRHDPNQEKDKNSIMHHPAFLSTSIRKDVPHSQYNNRNVVTDASGIKHHHLYKINVPKDTPGIFVKDSHNVDDRAKEFILPRDTKLRHIGSTVQKDSTMHYHEHEMEVVK